MRLNFAVIFLAFAVLAAPVLWHFSATLIGEQEARDRLAAETGREIAELHATVAAQEERISTLQARIDELDGRISRAIASGTEDRDVGVASGDTSDSLADAFAHVVLIANRRNVNTGMTVAGSGFLKEFLGLPREELSDECEEMTNEALTGMLELADVGPIRVKLLRPAIISLRQVFRNVQVYEPELYSRIRSAGSLCVRRVRGAEEAASAHAYGLAVDLNIDGQLDTLGDGKTQLGLTILAEFFRQEGWIWGAGFGREDSMHFEVSREKLEQWRRLGEI